MTDQPDPDKCVCDLEALGRRIESLGSLIWNSDREKCPSVAMAAIREIHRLTAPKKPQPETRTIQDTMGLAKPVTDAISSLYEADKQKIERGRSPASEPTRPSEAGMMRQPTDKDLGDRIDHVWTELIDLMSGMSDRLIDLERKARPRVHRATGG